MCGEQSRSLNLPQLETGSPPRVRGTVGYGEGINQLTRITPACAGNSCSGCKCPEWCRDHPRVCGEQIGRLAAYPINSGSPPRVRGTVEK